MKPALASIPTLGFVSHVQTDLIDALIAGQFAQGRHHVLVAALDQQLTIIFGRALVPRLRRRIRPPSAASAGRRAIWNPLTSSTRNVQFSPAGYAVVCVPSGGGAGPYEASPSAVRVGARGSPS